MVGVVCALDANRAALWVEAQMGGGLGGDVSSRCDSDSSSAATREVSDSDGCGGGDWPAELFLAPSSSLSSATPSARSLALRSSSILPVVLYLKLSTDGPSIKNLVEKQ